MTSVAERQPGKWYLAITTTRQIAPWPGMEKERGEFAVVRQLGDMGIEAFTPRRIDFVRQGKRRYADAIPSPFLPGYVFFEADSSQFYQATECRGISHTFMALAPKDLRSGFTGRDGKAVRPGQKYQDQNGKAKVLPYGVLDFRDYAAQKEAEAERIIERNDRAAMAQYDAGDILDIIAGPFADRAVRFIRMIDAAGQMPMLEVEIEMFGGRMNSKIDPLDVRKRATA